MTDRSRPPADAVLDPAVVWAGAAARGRRVLVVGDAGASSAARLEEAGATSVRAVASAGAIPEREEFDLVLVLSPLGADHELGLPERTLARGGLLLASAPSETRAAVRADLERRFAHVRAFSRVVLGAVIAAPEEADGAPILSVEDSGSCDARETLIAASDEPIPDLPGVAVAVADAAAAWEDRARGAEAEAAVTRWELYVMREAWRVVVARLAELEGRPLTRLSQRVRRVQLRRPPR